MSDNPLARFAASHTVIFGLMFLAAGVGVLAIAISSGAVFALVVSLVIIVLGLLIVLGGIKGGRPASTG